MGEGDLRKGFSGSLFFSGLLFIRVYCFEDAGLLLQGMPFCTFFYILRNFSFFFFREGKDGNASVCFGRNVYVVGFS